MNQIIKKYIIKRAIQDKWELKPKPIQKKYSFIICIPSYAEHEYIENTLLSISNQNKKYLKNTLIIIVINNGPNAKKTIISSNKKTNQILNQFKLLNICFVDGSITLGLSVKAPKSYKSLKSVGNMCRMNTLHLQYFWCQSHLMLFFLCIY